MSYLLYCIHGASSRHEPALSGINGGQVTTISHNGLCAVVSQVASSQVHPDISCLMTYASVIETLHRIQTVIPMRFGCLFDKRTAIIRLLKERASHFHDVMKAVHECTEMGIRILVPNNQKQPVQNTSKVPFCALENKNPVSSGHAYLQARKSHYIEEDKFTHAAHKNLELCRKAFDGLFIKIKAEPNKKNTAFISFFFLVPRIQVDNFKQTFRHISQSHEPIFLMSGPWPPYNFV